MLESSKPSATAARTKLQTFRLGTYVGRRLTLQSEATSIRRPQRRAGYFTNPSAMVDVHFAGSFDRRLEPHRMSADSRNIGRRTILPSAESAPLPFSPSPNRLLVESLIGCRKPLESGGLFIYAAATAAPPEVPAFCNVGRSFPLFFRSTHFLLQHRQSS